MNATEEFFRPQVRNAIDFDKLWTDFTFRIDYIHDQAHIYFREALWCVIDRCMLQRSQTDISDLVDREIIRWLRQSGRLSRYLYKMPAYRDCALQLRMEHEAGIVWAALVAARHDDLP